MTGPVRGLVDRIVLTPSEENHRLDIVLEGALSGLMALALRERKATMGQAIDNVDESMLVAGVRNPLDLPDKSEEPTKLVAGARSTLDLLCTSTNLKPKLSP